MVHVTRRRLGFIGAFCILIILAISFSSHLQLNEGQTVINWVVKSDPSEGDDLAFAICGDEQFLYIIGTDKSTGNEEFRIEKRYRSNGSLVNTWTYNSSKFDDILYDCDLVDGKLYVVGYEVIQDNGEWVILLLDSDLMILN